MHSVWTGTSDFSYQHWKGVFYPTGLAQKKWPSFYAQHYNTVEINATFYRSFAFGGHAIHNSVELRDLIAQQATLEA